MTPRYSKLLVNENVVPDLDADWQITGLDLILMTLVPLVSEGRTTGASY